MLDNKINNNSLKFTENQKVKVKLREDITPTLNKENKLDGLLFMEQMFNYCGQEYRILKIVKNIYMNKMINPTAPLYILEGLRCEGMSEFFSQRCDRTCNLVWHESWLEAV